ncbi:MAG: hypothetical protein ACTH7L_13850 [Psychrobacter alimentarius]
MNDKDKVIRIAVTQYDLHTILTALEFRADLRELEIAGVDEVHENSRDKDLMKKLEVFKTK